jgi:glutathione S-transferase
MELYFSPLACSMVVRIVADAADVPLTFREVELYVKQFTADGSDYVTAAPRGQVPVLVLDDGERLTEVLAISHYLAELRPDRGLLGATPRERHRVLEGTSLAATEVHKRILFVLGNATAPAEARAHARATAPRIFADVARTLGPRPFWAGERFSIADAYFAWALVVARIFGLDPGPLADYARRLAAVPSVARAITVETPLGQASWRRQREAVGTAPWAR